MDARLWQRPDASCWPRSSTGGSSSRRCSSRCLVPGVLLGVASTCVLTGADLEALGVDPTKAMLQHETGETALVDPALDADGHAAPPALQAQPLQRVRRMLGVWSFVYALLHLSMYLVFDQLCYSLGDVRVPAIWEDILKRPFIFVGHAAFVDPAAARDHLDDRLDAAAQEELAAAASARLRRGRAGDRALHLDSEVGHQRAAQVGALAGGAPGDPVCLRRPEASARLVPA